MNSRFKVARIIMFLCTILLIISWLFIYNFEYANIPNNALFTGVRWIFVSLIYIISIFLIIIIFYLYKSKNKKFKNKFFIFICLILSLNIIAIEYNRNEYINIVEVYIFDKNEIRNDYFIYFQYFNSRKDRLICSKKIYNTIIPNNYYILTYRGNKLNYFHKKLIESKII